jgi:error-prone DNA polymerase
VLIPRVHERYGHDRSALVAAFPTYRARGAIRELGKALGLPPGEIERVARGSEGWDARRGWDAREVGQDIDAALGGGKRGPTTGRWAWLARLAAEAHGLPRHLSQHSGGMIVATRPLIDCCPIVPAAMEGRQIVQWDKDSCADAGFLKIDLLGLGMLSAVERCVEMIARTRGRADRPQPDPLRRSGDVRVHPERRHDRGLPDREPRADAVAAPHPSENLRGHHDPGRDRPPRPDPGRRRQPLHRAPPALRVDPDFQVPYDHPSLEPVLRETLGTIIFQDQVLEVAIAFAGFSPGEAEGLRRAMSRKRSDAAIEATTTASSRARSAARGRRGETAERVFAMVKGFSGFGFPKAHGAAFGLLAYQSTWLRVHYGPEFLCSLLNEQPMGFYPPDALVHEAQRRGIEVLAPDVNESGVECDVDAAGTSGSASATSAVGASARAATGEHGRFPRA